MEYEKKYKEALARAKELCDVADTFTLTIHDIITIFPELKESKDDRIKREILEYINSYANLKDEKIPTEWLEWLEKQSEFDDNIITRNDEILQAISVGLTDVELEAGWSDFGGIPIEEIQDWLEKQSEQKETPCDKCKKEQPSHSCQDITELGRCALEKQDEKKSADKAEPKFKVGVYIVPDNITSSEIWKVINIEKDGYYSIQCITNPEYDEIYRVPAFILEKDYRLWTIEDAKAGDVLVYETDEVEWIFIYREIVPAASEVPHDLLRYYFLLEGNYFNWNGVSAMITDDYKLYLKPATKEQRDVLFSKMKEAGYEWDSEKKELKKIEVKTLNADKVIAWLVANICDFEHYVKLFKKDFGL